MIKSRISRFAFTLYDVKVRHRIVNTYIQKIGIARKIICCKLWQMMILFYGQSFHTSVEVTGSEWQEFGLEWQLGVNFIP